jgi:putative colanic acid biosynthesis acetyltransferase WcaF
MAVNEDTYTGPSFSFANRFARFTWNLIQVTLFRWSPRSFHGWRRWLLRMFGAKVGSRVHIYPGVKIWAPWNLEIGDEAGVGDGVILYSQGRISIGNRSVISQGAHLCSGTHDFEKEGFPIVTKPIIICSYAWVAAEVFVHPGVEIGEGTVVGARSVVVKSVPAWTVSAGNPCKTIKPREWRPKS